MPKPYPIELRERIMKAVDDGMPLTEAAQFYEIGLRTLKEWKALRNEMGSIAPRPPGSGRPPTVTEDQRELLCQCVIANPDFTLEQLKEETGLPVTLSRIHGILVEEGYSFKKRRSSPQKHSD